ncbi:MAG TPA: hypothetical protein VM491_03480 [Burkholderiaceae bacterium]|nr:hypothetical protein [Burkholderiaceae bacterium]
MAAIEEKLRHGPVHLIKRNKPAAVVVSQAEYDRLLRKQSTRGRVGMTALEWLLKHSTPGKKKKTQIDRELRRDREDWR